jgi:hypothetical protein
MEKQAKTPSYIFAFSIPLDLVAVMFSGVFVTLNFGVGDRPAFPAILSFVRILLKLYRLVWQLLEYQCSYITGVKRRQLRSQLNEIYLN